MKTAEKNETRSKHIKTIAPGAFQRKTANYGKQDSDNRLKLIHSTGYMQSLIETSPRVAAFSPIPGRVMGSRVMGSSLLLEE